MRASPLKLLPNSTAICPGARTSLRAVFTYLGGNLGDGNLVAVLRMRTSRASVRRWHVHEIRRNGTIKGQLNNGSSFA